MSVECAICETVFHFSAGEHDLFIDKPGWEHRFYADDSDKGKKGHALVLPSKQIKPLGNYAESEGQRVVVMKRAKHSLFPIADGRVTSPKRRSKSPDSRER